MILLLVTAAWLGPKASCQFAFQHLMTPSLDIRTTDGKRYADPKRQSADELVSSRDGKTIAISLSRETAVLVGDVSHGFRYFKIPPSPIPKQAAVNRYASPTVAWCFDGPTRLLAYFQDSLAIESLDLRTGKAANDDFTSSARLLPKFEDNDDGKSGSSIRVSPDGLSAAVTIGSGKWENEDTHDSETFLISRKRDRPKFLSMGAPIGWVDSRRVLIWHDHKGSGELFVVNVDGRVLAKRAEIAFATLSADGGIYAISVPYLGVPSNPRLFRLDRSLRNDPSDPRVIPVIGASWYGLNDGIAAIQP